MTHLKSYLSEFFYFSLFLSSILIGWFFPKKDIYINVPFTKFRGGPKRFVDNLSESSNLKFTNWNLSRVKKSLILYKSWGRSYFTASRLMGIKNILRVDGFYVPEDQNNETYQLSYSERSNINKNIKLNLELSDYIIYQSYFSRERIEQYFKISPKNSSIIYNGVNTNLFKPHSFEKNGLKIVTVGLFYIKNLRLLIEVFEKIRENNTDLNISLTIIGSYRNGKEISFKHIQDLLKDKKKIKDITIHHSVSLKQLPDILNRNNVYIHTKIGDWCPNSVLEAMSCGLPVICPSWGGTKELVGDAGAICQSKEWECDNALIDQMALDTIRIYKNLNEFSLKSRQRILDNFDLEKSLKEYTKILSFDGP